jgi:hypothetical protein
MSTVRCVECIHWSLRDAPVEVARYGFGVCKAAAPKTPWRYLSATCDRECATWARTGEEIVRERLAWLMKVWEMTRKEIEA